MYTYVYLCIVKFVLLFRDRYIESTISFFQDIKSPTELHNMNFLHISKHNGEDKSVCDAVEIGL